MLTEEFIYDLPEELIAQQPARERDQSRLLAFHRPEGAVRHSEFSQLPDFLNPGDLLVLNNSKVIPARLRGIKEGSGGAIELLLLEENSRNDWWVMLRPAKRLRPGDSFTLVGYEKKPSNATATLLEKNAEGHCRLRFDLEGDVLTLAHEIGELPLPPYVERAPGRPAREDLERYQTVFAKHEGSVAAPTAGLHFTHSMFEKLRARGVNHAFVTLHVGSGTFAPVKADRIEDHRMHDERYEIPEETLGKIAATKASGNRVVCVGTTSLRVLESAALRSWKPGANRTGIFIYPPFEFKVADALLTNFHLPKSTLLMLVSAFAAPGSTDGIRKMLAAYAEAVRTRYRFFSYGDAMLII